MSCCLRRVLLAVLIVTLPRIASAQASAEQFATVRYAGDGQRGYEWATFKVRYKFYDCPPLRMDRLFVAGSLSVSETYFVDGKAVPASPELKPQASRGHFAGDVVLRDTGEVIGRFSDSAYTPAGTGCTGDTFELGTLDDHLGKDATREARQAFLDRLTVANLETLGPLLNGTIESAVADKERKEKFEAEKAAAEKAAAEKAVAEKAAAEKAAAERAAAPRTASSPAPPQPQGRSAPSESFEQQRAAAATAKQESNARALAWLEKQRETQRESDRRQEEAGAEFVKNMAELGGQLARSMAEDAERDARRAEKRLAFCRTEPYRRIETPALYVEDGATLAESVTWNDCNGGFPTANYDFVLETQERLHFQVGGDGPYRVSVSRNGEELDNGQDFVLDLPPGSYVVLVKTQNASAPAEPYFLRIVREGCWTHGAVALEEGVARGRWDWHRCVSTAGRPYGIYELPKPSSNDHRDLTFTVKAQGASPKVRVLAGQEGRVLLVSKEVRGGEDEATVEVKDAWREPHYLQVWSEREQAPAGEIEIRAQQRALPYASRFLGSVHIALPGMVRFVDHGQRAPEELGFGGLLGFSLGAQVTSSFGIAAVVSGGAMAVIRDGERGMHWDAFGIVGPGLSWGLPERFARLTPGLSLIGPLSKGGRGLQPGLAVRLDGSYGETTKDRALLPFIEAHRNDGVTSLITGISFWIPPSRSVRPHDAF